MSLGLRWGSQSILLISAHLPPYHNVAEYKTSIDCIHELIEESRCDYLVIGVDAQAAVGSRQSAPWVGPNTTTRRDLVAPHFLDFVKTHDLSLLNTMDSAPSECWTCHYDYKLGSTPQQIDYVGVSRDLLDRQIQFEVTLPASTATESDHRPICVTLQDFKTALPARSFRSARSSLGWQMQDSEYPYKICDELELPLFPGQELEIALDPWAWHIWTDGSFTKGRRIPKRIEPKAGWGFAVFPQGCDAPVTRSQALLAACGHVTVDPQHRVFLGAVRRSNGTAEITALIELCFWLLKEGQHQLALSVLPGTRKRFRSDKFLIPLGNTIIVHVDAKYAIHAAEGTMRPKEN
eukprot:3338420-Pyramimonas_sp.AAC.1